MKKRFVFISFLFCICPIIWANKISIPADYTKIQQGIDSAKDGDTVIVSPGTYFENINFRTKKIVLTSYFVFNHDTSYIGKTIIDGSKPAKADSASCVIISKGQDSTAVLQGFTLTGGRGTAWKDEHSDGTYREGGGILIAKSSPVIQYNLIINNEAINKNGLASAGGGGIRSGDGNAKILNNVIINNSGLYGGGIVLNWCANVIQNNIIANNIGGVDFGGGGIWINNKLGKGNVVENNTIVNNYSVIDGGGILMYDGNAKAMLKNNIIFGNSTATTNPQISLRGASIPINYCDIEGGSKGIGNIDIFPQFTDTSLFLNNVSPCIDAGDTSPAYSDPASPQNSKNALFPSKGFIRNDIGAYGGPDAALLPNFKFSNIRVVPGAVSFGVKNKIDSVVKRKLIIINQSSYKRKIDSVIVKNQNGNLKLKYYPSNFLNPAYSDSIVVEWIPKNYEQFSDTLLVYHNATDIADPIKISVTGKAKNPVLIKTTDLNNSLRIAPNPFRDHARISYICSNYADIHIYDLNGRNVKTYKSLNGTGVLDFDSQNLNSGLYICQMVSGNNEFFFDKVEIIK
jgi:hypothetical protein